MAVHGVIAAGDPQTCAAGVAVLEAGGRAVDAILAAAFASFVVEPPLTSPAGAGVLLHGDRQSGFEILDFFAATPGLGLDRMPELDFHKVTVNFGPTTQPFHIGRGAVAVPGALVGLLEAHRKRGRIPLADIVAPAVAYARHGYRISRQVAWVNALLAPIVTRTAGVREIFCDAGALPEAGAVLYNRPFADFLEALAGDPADALAAFESRLLAEFGPKQGGLITAADLAAYRPVHRKPLRVAFGDFEILTNPPPASGGGLIAFALRLIGRMDLGPFLGRAHLTGIAGALRAVSEARLAGYDEQIGDPAMIEAFLSGANIDRWIGRVAARQEEKQLGGTTHISVLDAHGGAASLTSSNGEGCGHVLDPMGIHINNFLGEDDINPRGFHAFEPGTWMTTMMSPTVVLRDGEPRMVLGSGGSNRIRSAVTQALVNALVFQQPLDRCVNAPRLHVEGEKLWFEADGSAPDAVDALERDWPDAARFEGPNMFFGGVHAAACFGDSLVGGGDQRRGGTVAIAGTP